MKTAIITIASLLAIAGAVSASERCSDRSGYCDVSGTASLGSHGMTVFKPKAPNQPVDDQPGL